MYFFGPISRKIRYQKFLLVAVFSPSLFWHVLSSNKYKNIFHLQFDFSRSGRTTIRKHANVANSSSDAKGGQRS